MFGAKKWHVFTISWKTGRQGLYFPAVKQGPIKLVLIRTPARAAISLCLAAGLAAWHLWLTLANTPERSFWTFPFYPVPSASTLSALKLTYLVCASLFVCLLVTVCRCSAGNERLFLAAWLAAWTLTPLKSLLTVQAATTIEGVQAAGMLVASLAALRILRAVRPSHST